MAMSSEQGPKSAGLLARTAAILLRPNVEWDVIDGESTTIRRLFFGYVCILAAIPSICSLIGGQFFAYVAPFLHIHPPLLPALVRAVVGYLAAVVGTLLLGFIINALAPSFDGEKNIVQAMKVAVYSSTAGWVAGIFGLIPALAVVGALCSLYGIYLLYTGLAKLMKAPSDKAVPYTIVTILCVVLIFFVARAVVAASAGPMLWNGFIAPPAHSSSIVNVEGQTIDAQKLAEAVTAAAKSTKAMETAQADGKTPPATDPAKLKALLPDQVAGLPRTGLSTQSAGSGGVATSNAEATYARGDARITLTVTDMSAMGALAAITGAMGAERSNLTANGYEKFGKIDGRFTTEAWNRAGGNGRFAVLVANRFVVQAQGSAPSIDELKAAVAAVGPDRLEALAKS
jgi:uncharacterized membrane protein